MTFKIDFDFLHKVEGYELKGYVPRNGSVVIGQSGVTIGAGYDLGQQSIQSLKALKLTPSIEAKLAPYIGLKKEAAVAALKAKGLLLSEPEGKELVEKVNLQYAYKVSAMWSHYSNTPFASLNQGAQTVIMSVAYQYGDLPKRTPNFWRTVVAQDWKRAYKQLLNFGDRYTSRRKMEAEYLRKYIV